MSILRVVLGVALWTSVVVALATSPIATEADDSVAPLPGASTPANEQPIGGSADASGEDFFAAGAAPHVDRDVTGDAFAAGGKVRLRGAVGGDAVLAGGEVSIDDQVDDDLYVAGGSILVQATVRGNARLAGGRVVVAPTGNLLGRATIAAGRAQIAGRIGQTLAVYADRVDLQGDIGGDVQVVARELRVGPSAQIGGRLSYRSTRPADISASAVIAGGVEFVRSEVPDRLFGRIARTAAWVGAALLVLSLLVVGTLLVVAAPEFSAQAASTVMSSPGRSLALGFALVVSVPAAAVLAIATVVGIPLGLLLLLCYPVMLLVGYLTASLFLGDRIAGLMRGRAIRAGVGLRLAGLALALVLLALLTSVPYAGPFLFLAALMVGLGACALRCWHVYSGTRRATAPGSAQPRGESS